MIRRLAATAALLVALALIALATLRPQPEAAERPAPRERAAIVFELADSLRNVLLFAPVGAAAVLLGLRPVAVLGAGLLLSAGIEGAQLALPGRDPSLRDVATNGGGALLGALLVRHARAWLRPSPPARRALAAAALAGAVGFAAGTGPLLALAPTTLPLFGHWTPELGHLALYAGHLGDVRVGGVAVPHGPLTNSPALREALAGDFRVQVEGRAGAPPATLAAFLLVTDADGEEILLLGPDRQDLVFRFRSLGRRLGLEPMRVRGTDMLAGLQPGDALRAQALRAGADLCLVVDDDERCGLGPSVADGWMLLVPAHRLLDRLRALLGAAWIAALLAPLGLWVAPRGPGALLWLGAGLALVVLPPLTGLLPTPPHALVAGVAGLLAGCGLRRWARRSRAGTGTAAEPIIGAAR